MQDSVSTKKKNALLMNAIILIIIIVVLIYTIYIRKIEWIVVSIFFLVYAIVQRVRLTK